MPDHFFSIRNWKKFQHYTKRNPPWIRLYRDLLRDRAYQNLSDTCRSHLVGLFIIASSTDNHIPDDQVWLRHELCTKSPIDLKALTASGWIIYESQDASMLLADPEMLAPCKQPFTKSLSETEVHSRSTERASAPAPNGGMYAPDFEIFWTAYPKKVGKGKAWELWKKLRPARELQDKILLAVAGARSCSEWVRDRGKYIPNPATWLGQRRWDDEPGQTADRPHSVHDYL